MAIQYGPDKDEKAIRVVTATSPMKPSKAAVVAKFRPSEAPAPKKGRPSTGNAKVPVTIRLDGDLVELMQDDPEWRAEVNAVLRRHYEI